jgi:hypothetical protein
MDSHTFTLYHREKAQTRPGFLTNNIMRNVAKIASKKQLPEMFKPLLWGLKWDALDVWKNREDIILTALNNGDLSHLKWIIKTYGKDEIKKVISSRLETEIYPESRNLAKVLFSIVKFRKSR